LAEADLSRPIEIVLDRHDKGRLMSGEVDRPSAKPDRSAPVRVRLRLLDVATNKPLANCPVEIRGSRFTTDRLGRLQYNEFRPGVRILPVKVLSSNRGVGGLTFTQPLVILPNQQVIDCTMKVRSAKTLRFRLEDLEGRPVPEESVSCYRIPNQGGIRSVNLGFATDEQGEFRIADVRFPFLLMEFADVTGQAVVDVQQTD
jgi:hypothetical protein